MAMEAKDWITIAIALYGAATGTYAAVLYWRRDQREKKRDQREEKASDPQIDLEFRRSSVANCWDCNPYVTSHQQPKLTVKYLRILEPTHIEFVLGDAPSTHRGRQAAVNTELTFGQRCNFPITADDPITKPTPISFEVTTVTHAEIERDKSFTVKRTLRP
jgi:hypothetical protein